MVTDNVTQDIAETAWNFVPNIPSQSPHCCIIKRQHVCIFKKIYLFFVQSVVRSYYCLPLYICLHRVT